MGYLSQIAGLYAALFVISLVWWNYWLSLAVGLFGVFLVVVLALMLDNVDESKAEDAWVRKRVNELEEEMRRLQQQMKDHMDKKGKIELL